MPGGPNIALALHPHNEPGAVLDAIAEWAAGHGAQLLIREQDAARFGGSDRGHERETPTARGRGRQPRRRQGDARRAAAGGPPAVHISHRYARTQRLVDPREVLEIRFRAPAQNRDNYVRLSTGVAVSSDPRRIDQLPEPSFDDAPRIHSSDALAKWPISTI